MTYSGRVDDEQVAVSCQVELRSALAGIPVYVPGRAAHDMGLAKLSSNENPFPPLPSVLAALGQAAATINRYPDLFGTELVAAIAEKFGTSAESVAIGTGSIGVLTQIIADLCTVGDEVIYAWRSFEAYPIVVQLAGATAVQIPLSAGQHDLPAMAAAITSKTKVIVLCSPNNPTGDVISAAALTEFLLAVPAHILVVLDEAYAEFVSDPQALAGPQFMHYPNVVFLRTFSKAYGLAGLRVGFAVGHPKIMIGLRKAALPFGVSALAQQAAVVSLAAWDELQPRVASLVAERDRVEAELRMQGWRLRASQGNFLWFPLGERSAEFAHACLDAGFTVRRYGSEGVRVTVGEVADNNKLLAVTRQFNEK